MILLPVSYYQLSHVKWTEKENDVSQGDGSSNSVKYLWQIYK